MVLSIFVKAGAPEEILYDHKPHIGTDVLSKVVKKMREEIIRLGGEVRFQTKVTGVLSREGTVPEIPFICSMRLRFPWRPSPLQ